MNGWIWVAIGVAILLTIGGWTDWQRRYSTGGDTSSPIEARRDAQTRGGIHNPPGSLG